MDCENEHVFPSPDDHPPNEEGNMDIPQVSGEHVDQNPNLEGITKTIESLWNGSEENDTEIRSTGVQTRQHDPHSDSSSALPSVGEQNGALQVEYFQEPDGDDWNKGTEMKIVDWQGKLFWRL